MTITPIRYIFLLLLISISLFAKDVDATFEVLHTKYNYLDVVQKEALKLKIEGFKCYIVKTDEELSLRCNDSKSSRELQKNIQKFNDKNISFVIINKGILKEKPKQYKTIYEFYLGYAAFDRGEYKKALEIFEYNYKKKNNFEHAYAYALALMKTRQYEKALSVLAQYKSKKKARKLYRDIASTYMYKALNKGDYQKAREVVYTYIGDSKKLYRIINEKEVNDLAQKKEYEKAKALAKEYHLENKIFDIDYLIALDLVKQKEYQNANIVLAPYFNKEKKAKELLISNVIAIASRSYEAKEYQQALDKLQGYLNYSQKVKDLYSDILFNRALENGWNNLEEKPKEALNYFKAACSVKQDYGCYSGMMYSYFNLKMYEQSLYLAHKLYVAKQTDELSTMAMRSALKLERFDDAKYWFGVIKNKKGLTDPALLETFLRIDEYIKAKKYKDAKYITDYLITLYPDNVNVLTKQMQLYILDKKYTQAYESANKILEIDSNSSDAKYTLALYDYENKQYEGCVGKLEDINITQRYRQELYNKCRAYMYAEKKDINKAIGYMEKLDDKDVKAAFYLEIGDLYKSHGYEEAIRAYKKAKEYRDEDFDLELIYLYALKDFLKDDILDKALQIAYKKYPNKQEELDKFKVAYQKDRLFSYYKNHIYMRCYKYGNLIERELNDIDVYRMTGWCAYQLEKYDDAKEKFAKINYKFGESTEDIYAYALSCYQNREFDRAIESLDRLKVIDSEKYAILIASLYMDLHKQDSAKKILLKLPESDRRDAMLVKINKSFTKESYENSASVGMYYQSQNGVNGKNRFDKYVVPIDYDYYDKYDKYHLYFDGDLLYLYNGYLTDNGGSYLDFGLNSTTKENDLTSDIGFMPKVGLDYRNIKAEIGLTPVGAKITPELTWLLSADFLYEKLLFNLQFKQQEIDETMLSFVGERAVKNNLEVNWGRVVKRGFEGGMSYDDNVILSFNVAYYPQIFGLNVIDNNEFKTTLSAVYHPKVESISYADIGAIVAYDSYEKNSNLFTYGHGGYFSPQDFWLGSLFLQFGDIVSNKFYYQSKLSLGFEGFIVEDAQKFPISNDPTLIGIQPGYSNGGVTYKAAVQFGYNLTDNMDLISGFAIERMYSYEVKEASFALVYRFNPSKYRTFNTFRLNHRVDKIIK